MFFWNPYIHSYEKKMIEANKKYWAKFQNVRDGEQWIYVFRPLDEYFSFATYENIIAKGLQSKKNLPIAGITYGSACSAVFEELDNSFGIETHFRVLPGRSPNILSQIKIRLLAKWLVKSTYGKREKLKKIRYRGIECGDAIYDSLTRLYTKGRPIFDCFDLPKKVYFEAMQDTLSLVDNAHHIFKLKRPSYVVAANPAFFWKLPLEVARQMGATIIYSSPFMPDCFNIFTRKGKGICNTTQQELIEESIKDKIKKSGDIYVDEDLFLHKSQISGTANLRKRLGITNNNKIVFIMVHCLTDAPRENSNLEVYSDYNEWFLDTLRIVKQIPDVNWVVKDHPMASYYYQDDYVKKVFEENKTDNMFYCGKELGGTFVKEAADCIITYAGDVGIEYWAYGIPTITLAHTYYSDAKISYNIETVSEYEAVLNNIEKIPRPDDNSIKRARSFLQTFKNIRKGKDAVSKFFSHTMEAECECFTDADFEKYYSQERNRFCRGYIKLLVEEDLRNCELFKMVQI